MQVVTLARKVGLTLIVLLLLALSLGACGQGASSPTPATPPSGFRLQWQGTLGPKDFMAIPPKQWDSTVREYWVWFSVSGSTGHGRNALVVFGPAIAASTSPRPAGADSVGRAWRVQDGDSYSVVVRVPSGTWTWSLQKGQGYSVKAAVYVRP